MAAEVAWRPLYPWDAWVQWATKARVWYELGHLAPFVRADVWLAGGNGAYFDASPNYPATVPLLQVWTCVALGRWDDSAMNWPWLAILVALVAAMYGALRGEGVAPLLALFGAYLLASLPLVDVHVALAGYADLPMGSGVCDGRDRVLSLGQAPRLAGRGDCHSARDSLSADQDARMDLGGHAHSRSRGRPAASPRCCAS